MKKLKKFALFLVALIYNIALLTLGTTIVYDNLFLDGPSERGSNMWMVFVAIIFLFNLLQVFVVNPKGKEFLEHYPKKPRRWIVNTKAWLWILLWLSLAMYIPMTAFFGFLTSILLASQMHWVISNYDANVALAAQEDEYQEKLAAQARQG